MSTPMLSENLGRDVNYHNPDITTIPPGQTAIKQVENGKLAIKHDEPIPALEPDMVLVKAVAVALNPTDYKIPDHFPCPGTGNGGDVAGIIVAIGDAVAEDELHGHHRLGDRVFGAVHGSDPLHPMSGAFAEYVAVYAHLLLTVPPHMSWAEAAAMSGVVVGTVGLALFHSLNIPARPDAPTAETLFALVYGGSTACGTMAIQLLRSSGVRVITTCSPKNFDLVRSYGAEKCFDYRSASCAADIRAYTQNGLRYVLDTITEAQTMRLCYAAIGRGGGRYTGLEMIPPELAQLRAATVTADWVMGPTLTGQRITGMEGAYNSEASPARREFARMWYATVQRLLDAGRLKAHPPRVMPGGFAGILDGLGIMRRQEVSGEKLVYFLHERAASPER